MRLFSKIPILPYEAERRISPSHTCNGVPFVKRRAAASPLYARVRELHSSNRDKNGTRPGSSRADESGFRCVNAEVNASSYSTLGTPDLGAKFVSWEQGLTGNENL